MVHWYSISKLLVAIGRDWQPKPTYPLFVIFTKVKYTSNIYFKYTGSTGCNIYNRYFFFRMYNNDSSCQEFILVSCHCTPP